MMALGLNQYVGVGRMADDAELRTTNNGQPVLHGRIMIPDGYYDRDKNWKNTVEYVSFTMWGDRGKELASVLRKGTIVAIAGKLKSSSYDDRDGNKRWKTEVNCSSVSPMNELAASGGGDDGSGDQGGGGYQGGGNRNGGGSGYRGQQGGGQNNGGGGRQGGYQNGGRGQQQRSGGGQSQGGGGGQRSTNQQRPAPPPDDGGGEGGGYNEDDDIPF